MAYIYDLTDTWNAGGTTFNAIKMNVTDSASAAGSKLVTLQTNGTEHFSVTKAGVGYFSGNVGIGTSSVSSVFGTTVRAFNAGNGATLQIGGSTVNAYFFASEGLGRSTVGNSTAHPLTFITSDTERMRIDSSGNLLVGTTDSGISSGSGVKINPNYGGSGVPNIGVVTGASTGSTTSYSAYSTGAAAYRFYVDNAGTIFATSTSISAISDQRLKENVRDLDAGLDAVLALKPRRFDWKEGKGKDIKDDMGFIAQEVENVLPELIGGWKAGEGEPDDLKSVRAGDLIPVLVKAIQELTARVAQLEGN